VCLKKDESRENPGEKKKKGHMVSSRVRDLKNFDGDVVRDRVGIHLKIKKNKSG